MEKRETVEDLINLAEEVKVFFDTRELCSTWGFAVVVDKANLIAELAKNELLDWTKEELREEGVWTDFHWRWDNRLLWIFMR